MIKRIIYNIDEVAPYINWTFFFYAWGMFGKPEKERMELRKEAEKLLANFKTRFKTYAIFGLFDANSDGDDLILNGVRMPMLRQQHVVADGEHNLCLTDFVRPKSLGITDRVGVFATSVDMGMAQDNKNDAYTGMLAQVISDRLAEATTEKMHEEVRKSYWGYAPDETLTVQELFKGHYRGIRAAVGYPSIPDMSINFIISDLIGMSKIGINLTDNGMMNPHSSTSGLMFAHPKAKYFDVGAIDETQLNDYAGRRGLPVGTMRKYLNYNLNKI